MTTNNRKILRIFQGASRKVEGLSSVPNNGRGTGADFGPGTLEIGTSRHDFQGLFTSSVWMELLKVFLRARSALNFYNCCWCKVKNLIRCAKNIMNYNFNFLNCWWSRLTNKSILFFSTALYTTLNLVISCNTIAKTVLLNTNKSFITFRLHFSLNRTVRSEKSNRSRIICS